MKQVSRKRLKSPGVFEFVNGIFMLLFSFITFYPIWFVFVNAFNSAKAANLGTVNLLPKEWSVESFKVVLSDPDILNGFFITGMRTIIATSLHVLFTALVAYGMSKPYLKGRKFYMRFALITMLFNGGLIPNFILMTKLNLVNNFLVFIIPAMFTFFDMIIFINFYKTIPDSLEESARVDGASDYTIFFRIILPNSKPVLATISLFAAVYHWNDYYQGVIYIRDRNLIPLQTLLYKIIAENSMNLMQQRAVSQFGARLPGNSIKFASMLVATVPILLVYPFVQRYLVKGLMIGAVKG